MKKPAFLDIKTGFTLIELIISIAIFLVLVGMMIANFHNGSIRDSVRQAANITQGALRLAQNKTMSGELLPSGAFPAGGYGVYTDDATKNVLILFADVDGDHQYLPSADTIVEQINLQKVVYIQYSVGVTKQSFVFFPPNGDACYKNDAGTEEECGGDWTMQLIFKANGTDYSKSVSVDARSGLIKVD